MILIQFFRYILKILLCISKLALTIIYYLFVFIACLGAITVHIGKLLFVVSAFMLITSALPHLFMLSEITLRDIWENLFLWLTIPLPFLFLQNISLFVSDNVLKIRNALARLIDRLNILLKSRKNTIMNI